MARFFITYFYSFRNYFEKMSLVLSATTFPWPRHRWKSWFSSSNSLWVESNVAAFSTSNFACSDTGSAKCRWLLYSILHQGSYDLIVVHQILGTLIKTSFWWLFLSSWWAVPSFWIENSWFFSFSWCCFNLTLCIWFEIFVLVRFSSPIKKQCKMLPIITLVFWRNYFVVFICRRHCVSD